MKRFQFLAFMLAIIAGIGLFASCGSDDDPAPNNDTNNNNNSNNSSNNSGIPSSWNAIAGIYLTYENSSDLVDIDGNLAIMIRQGDTSKESVEKIVKPSVFYALRITPSGVISDVEYSFSFYDQPGSLCWFDFSNSTFCYYKTYEKKIPGTFTFKNGVIYQDGTAVLKVDTSELITKKRQEYILTQLRMCNFDTNNQYFFKDFNCTYDLQPLEIGWDYYSQVK